MLLMRNVLNQKNPPDELAHKKKSPSDLLIANTKFKHKKESVACRVGFRNKAREAEDKDLLTKRRP